MQWIDRQTRAVLIEFSAYNPNINLVMVSTILVEFLPAGSILTLAKFDPLNLFSESSSGISLKTLCELGLLGFAVYFMLRQFSEMVNSELKEYFSQFWTFIEWSIICTAFISLSMFLVRLKAAQGVLDFFKTTHGYGYMNLQHVNACNQILTFSLGACSTLGTVKFMKMMRFIPSIAHLSATLRFCFAELVGCSVAFGLIWIAFVQLMYFIYGTGLEGYASLVKSAESAFLMVLGKFDAKQILHANSSLGVCVFAAYNLVILCFALNIFVSIITDAFDLVRREASWENEFNVGEYVASKWRRFQSERRKIPRITHENYVDRLGSFNLQINRIVDLLNAVSNFPS
jgi:polycystin 1L2